MLLAARCAVADPTEYLADSWGLAEGLPQLSVLALAQDETGYLWLGTEGELARFDGSTFEIFDRHTHPDLPGHFVTSLLRDGDGLWIGMLGALVHRSPTGALQVYNGDDVVDVNIQCLIKDSTGAIWFGTPSGLFRFHDSAFSRFTRNDGLAADHVRSLAEDRSGRLWIGTTAGLTLWDGEEMRSWTTADGLVDNEIRTLYEDTAGNLWIGSRAGVQRFADDRLQEPEADFLGQEIRTLHEDSEGRFWVGGAWGLALYENGVAQVPHEKLRDVDVLNLWEDHEGSLWIATRFHGLWRLRERPITVVGVDQGLAHNITWSVLEGRGGDLWIATETGLCRRTVEGQLSCLTRDDGLPASPFSGLHEDRAGNLWAGTVDGGLVRVQGNELRVFDEEDGFPREQIRAIHEDRVGRLWVATGVGLFCYQDEHFTVYTSTDGLPADSARGLWESPDGTLWVLTTQGLARFVGRGSLPFEPIPAAWNGAGKTFFAENDRTFWIGTWDSALYRFNEGELHPFSIRKLGMGGIHAILDDDHGALWLSSNQGIFRINKSELNDFVAGRRSSFVTTAFDERDGMGLRECNGSRSPAGWRGRDGRLYFATMAGVAVVDPSRLATRPPPRVHVQDFLVEHQSIDFSSHREIGPNVGSVELRYGAIAFHKPEEVRFRYRLVGYEDGGWIDQDQRRSIQFTNLPPGAYRFEVTARNTGGEWNENPAAVSFVVVPAFTQTSVFYLLCFLAVLLFGRGFHELRVRRLRRRNAELERTRAELELRNAELSAANAEMERFNYAVSHDLRSPIFTIEGFVGLLEKDAKSGDEKRVVHDASIIRNATAKMGSLLDAIQELARIRQGLHPTEDVDLSEVVDEARGLVEPLLTEANATFRLAPNLPRVRADRACLREVFRILIDNAIRHHHGPEKARVEIEAFREDGKTVCKVRDNGVGIAPRYQELVFGLFEKLDADGEGKGMGLAFAQRMIEAHGGRIRVESRGLGHGSTFVFTLPDP